MGIYDAYIDFRSHVQERHGQSDLWRKKIREYKYEKWSWQDKYRFRPLVEGVFSSIKRKFANYLRSQKNCARDVEILLKVLVYNLGVIGRHSLNSSE